MNHDAQRLAQSMIQLALMANALASLSKEVLPKNPRMFALMAEGPLEEIRRLHLEVCEQVEALNPNHVGGTTQFER